ncbi:ankyrin repeat-containing domain protein [Pyronema domesticum]|nr:ankyrin repeat-containing domain protein [Pyronema domesticum]
MQQRTEIVSLFTTRNDLDLNLFSRYGKTPLVHTLDSPSVYTLLQILLARKDLNPNLPDNEGRFPLLLAVEYGMVEAVRMLLQRGDLDINKPGILSTAVRRDVRILEMLLERHDVDVNRTDNKGKRAIEVAVEAGNTEVVDLLVGRGDVEVRDADWEAIKKLRDAKKD